MSDQETAHELRRFVEGFATLVLATVSEAGEPEASYAPFVRDREGAFHVYLSELAAHTANLRTSARASVLLIEDEAGAAEPFARRRLSLRCSAAVIARASPEWTSILDRFEAQRGPVVRLIRPLEDFVLFRLTARSATYVRGFAQASRIEGAALEALLRPV